MNRKARRTFDSLFRKRRLRRLASTGQFSSDFCIAAAAVYPERW